jgi:IS4 transposase
LAVNLCSSRPEILIPGVTSVDAVLKRFVKQAPIAVMARLGLQRAISADWVNEVFERHSNTQYTRELLFSTVVDLMSLVALGLRPSLHAAAQKMRDDLPVSITALYDKVNRIEPNVVQALVRGSAERLAPVMVPLRKGHTPWLDGWRVRVVDGNHLPASEKRLAPLRSFRGAALPGHSLVVFDPDAGLVIDLVPCEDGHASERNLLAPLLAASQQGELWIGDSLFCTRSAILSSRARGSAVLFRETKANPNPTPIGHRRRIGQVETGVVYEQRVTIPNDTGDLELRRIKLVLDTPTTGSDTVIRLLTTLPKTVGARAVARLYRKRWTIERLFGRLEAALQSEIRTLGYPRAALFAFGLAVVAFNVLAVIEAAVAAAHDLQASGIEVSTYYIADDVRTDYRGMLIAIDAQVWSTFDAPSPTELARTLRDIAAHVDPRTIRKHPRAPKTPKPKGYASAASVRRHVATARVLRDGKIK